MAFQPTSWRQPILELLHPREQTRLAVVMLALAVGLGALVMQRLSWPLWQATALGLGLLLLPGVAKWRADARRYGWATALLSALLVAQGFHGIEHIAQWLQYHVLGWSMRASSGLLSPANSEWVHFGWNWLVLLCVLGLLRGGMRNPWAWLLAAWAAAHTFEHTYMFVRHLEVLAELRRMGVAGVTAQGLPGILGEDGWLARSPATQGSFLCRLPGLATAPRLDVHFWWNMGETLLLLLAANTYLLGGPLGLKPAATRAKPAATG